MTVVIAKAHIQVFLGGIQTDVLPGVSFDATPAQIAALLPIAAIYPIGSTAPVLVGVPSPSPLIVGHGAPASGAGSTGQTYIDVDGHGVYENLGGAWVLLGSLGAVSVIGIGGTPGPATVGVAYAFTPSTANGSGTKTFALTGTLPAGLAFSTSTGAISGTPTTAGTTSGLRIGVTDASGSAQLGPFSIVVGATAPATSPGGGPSNTADFADPNNAYLVAALAA